MSSTQPKQQSLDDEISGRVSITSARGKPHDHSVLRWLLRSLATSDGSFLTAAVKAPQQAHRRRVEDQRSGELCGCCGRMSSPSELLVRLFVEQSKISHLWWKRVANIAAGSSGCPASPRCVLSAERQSICLPPLWRAPHRSRSPNLPTHRVSTSSCGRGSRLSLPLAF